MLPGDASEKIRQSPMILVMFMMICFKLLYTSKVGKEDFRQGALGKIYGAYCQNVNPGPAWFAYSCLYRAVIANTRVSCRREEAECQWKRDFAFQRPAGKVHPALVGEGGVSPGTHTFCKKTAYPCMPFLAK